MKVMAGLLLMVAAALVQVTWAAQLEIAGAFANLVLIAVVGLTWTQGVRAGLLWACVGGILLDLNAPGPLGPHSLALLAGAYATAFWARNLDRDSPFHPSAAALLSTVARAALDAAGGIISAGHGVALVQNTPVWNLQVISADLPTDARQRAAELAALATLAGQPEDRLEASLAVADPFSPARMGTDLSEAQVLAINERLPSLPGASIAHHAVRTYAEPMTFGHVIGYVGPLDDTDLQRLQPFGYQPDELVGKVGVEAGLESILRGSDGWSDVVVNARGHVVMPIAMRPPAAGHAVYLPIDASRQRARPHAPAHG